MLNRGEAALRFVRAVKEYNNLHSSGLKTVAFFTEREEYAPFVKMADEAFPLHSYMNHELMLEALSRSGCDAVWVGWGFISEDAVFTEKVEKAGLVFLGPSSEAMALLGDKITAKNLAEKSDVPILPWSKKAVRSYEEAKSIAEEIGYPVIVKAANAGGGRGIRFVRYPKDLEGQFKSAREETIRFTGGDVVFIEYLVEKGRHLEVQVLADVHGNVHTFGVRDCSVQRKNQKIIEETPAPGMSSAFMADMEAAAARLIEAADYTGAGTVEYLYDIKSGRYFFMEVNTRLQVEHPITETLYGFDLVRGQIDVAMGKTLDPSEKQARGAVIEVRLNAEDPDRDFSPAPGRVEMLKMPSGPGIRVDSGIEEYSDIPGEFDSMLAKIIAHGSDRPDAISRLKRALEELRVRLHNGTSNKAFLLKLLDLPQIREGGVHTGFVEELLRSGMKALPQRTVELALLAGAVEMYRREYRRDFLNFQQEISRTGRPRGKLKSEGYEVNISAFGVSYSFLVRSMGSQFFHLRHKGQEIVCRYVETEQEAILYYGGTRHNILMVHRGDALQCEVDGYPVLLESDSGGYVKAHSPAIVLGINVNIDEEVTKGDVLLTLEAMKMEMLIEAPADGIVKDVMVHGGSQVAAGQSLVLIESKGEEEREAEKDTQAVAFSCAASGTAQRWEIHKRELFALFLGYDSDKDPSGLVTAALDFVRDQREKGRSEYEQQLIAAFITLFQLYISVEKLFTKKEVESESLARPVTYQELLSHYFRRSSDKEKGLPEEFLTDLKTAVDAYPIITGLSEEQQIDFALFNIFRSHGNGKEKQKALKDIFFALESLSVPEADHPTISDKIDRIVELTQKSYPSLADSAIHARYEIVDRKKLEEQRQEHYRAVQSMVGRVRNNGQDAVEFSKIIDAGPYILKELITRALSEDTRTSERALRLIALRSNRDRRVTGDQLHRLGSVTLCSVQAEEHNSTCTSLFAVLPESRIYEPLPFDQWLAGSGYSSVDEITIFVLCDKPDKDVPDQDTPQKERCEEIFNRILQNPGLDSLTLSPLTLSAGLYNSEERLAFRSYTFTGTWQENTAARGFSPLQYRELRVYRLKNFNLQILYNNDSVILLEATSRENPKDIRLFAFADVSETEPETDSSNSFRRLLMFENLYMEAVFAMRSAQAKYRYRLQWNRIVIHNRNLLHIKYRELRDYGLRLMHAAGDLGLEKLTVYTRRKRWSEDRVRELQLDFSIVTEDQLVLRNRRPSEEPLESFDQYVTKAVRSRQRGMVYPYEFIKMLTSTGISKDTTIPGGVFEEFDIEVDPSSGEQYIVSVKDREPGHNTANVVFGIITNNDKDSPSPFTRVILLSDPSGDLGSLAEAEARRVNAALDLAEERKLPVEWLPVSSGAKINMESGTENLDWTASTLRRIVEFTQGGGEINIIVAGINVGAQSYWNAEATMLMHTRGLLIMTDDASMLLTGKKALDFSGSVSGEDNLDIGGVEKIMGPNGQAQIKAPNLAAAYQYLFRHYRCTYVPAGQNFPLRQKSTDSVDRDISIETYNDFLNQGFSRIGDIFSKEKNPERKKPFDIRQVMQALIDRDASYLERWRSMQDSDTGIVWESRIGGYPLGLIGIESRNLPRIGEVPFDGPESWSGGTLFPQSSKKIARGINAFSGRLPLVMLANLSGFDGSPESLRRLQLEYGAEIGRAVVNFKGPIVFVVVARYHGGAYVVFSKKLNPMLRVAALEGSYASVIGGAPAAAVIFPKIVLKDTYADSRVVEAQKKLKSGSLSQKEYDEIFAGVKNEKQNELSLSFDRIHSVERAATVGSIDDIITPKQLRPYIVSVVEEGMGITGGKEA
ncbi:MAG: carboxyl transferase domain-containing protein [Spirochaetia bacterium]